NRAFAKRCAYHSLQAAVFDSHNNDRIVVMPGVYTEPKSRKQPTKDPKCAKYLTDTDFGGGGPVGLSYRYQWHCPNDQSLVNVLGTDGYLLDRDKFFYAGEYGALMFTSDHGLTENCEGVGNGDSAVYPGGAPETDDDPAPNPPDARDTAFYPRARLNTKITRC